MKLPLPIASSSQGEFGWKSASFVEKVGKWPLIGLLIPLFLLLYWLGVLMPENANLRHEIKNMQQTLSVSLPIKASDQATKDTPLSATEYQRVKMIFDILAKYHLQADGTRYNFSSNDETSDKTLRLDMPLKGNWASLARALREITMTQPVTIDLVSVKRAQPDTSDLTITLQLTLRREG